LTVDQIILFVLLFFVFAFLIWGRWRYDLVAFCALLLALLSGVVPTNQAFSGFGHPAVVIIALVLIVSRGLSNSGAIELLARFVLSGTRKLAAHITIMSSVAAVLSALMNNVAALALLMPVDLQAAKKAKRSPSLSLMPLSFASILGGMITLIGTPPNIVIAEFRNDSLGAPFRMFDFAPVGIACAAVGVAFVALIGWRLLPTDNQKKESGRDLFDLADYIAELKVGADSPAIGKKVRELDDEAQKNDLEILGLVRKGRRMPGLARMVEVQSGDLLVVEANPENIEASLGAMGLEYVGTGVNMLKEAHLSLIEVVVPETSRLAGRSTSSIRMLYRYGVALVGVSRQGKRFRENVRQLVIKPGDVLLLLGSDERLRDATNRLNFLPLQDRGQRVIQRGKAWLAVGRRVFADRPGMRGWCLRLHEDRTNTGCIRVRGMARNSFAGEHDSDRRCIANHRRHRPDSRGHRGLVDGLLAGRGTDAPDDCDDDLVRRHEQHGDGGDRGANRPGDRSAPQRQSGSVSDGRGGSRIQCIPDADRTQEQHLDNGSWRVPIR
jgi:di/tricarboxylate transporter